MLHDVSSHRVWSLRVPEAFVQDREEGVLAWVEAMDQAQGKIDVYRWRGKDDPVAVRTSMFVDDCAIVNATEADKAALKKAILAKYNVPALSQPPATPAASPSAGKSSGKKRKAKSSKKARKKRAPTPPCPEDSGPAPDVVDFTGKMRRREDGRWEFTNTYRIVVTYLAITNDAFLEAACSVTALLLYYGKIYDGDAYVNEKQKQVPLEILANAGVQMLREEPTLSSNAAALDVATKAARLCVQNESLARFNTTSRPACGVCATVQLCALTGVL